MEIKATIWMNMLKRCMAAAFFILFIQQQATAQVYTVKGGKMFIEVNKNINKVSLDSFITRFDLGDLALEFFIRTNNQDSLKLQGWHVEKNNDQLFAISKPLISAEDLTNVVGKIMLAENPFAELVPSLNNALYGINKFKNKSSFAVTDSTVTFYLRGYTKYNKVNLAGSFNNWDPGALSMTRVDSGWIVTVKLVAGMYMYKFITDGSWIVDGDNHQKENDGKGNINSIFFKTNYVFRLNGYPDAKKVYVAGSFNNWNPKELLLNRSAEGWELPLYLANGTYTYRFIIDGNWIADPANPDKLPNEFDDFNSVIRLGKSYLFKLKGYDDAKQVLLTGSFNGWRKDELLMKKTDSGWVLPYSLGPGNYEYRFIVDHTEITDPVNPFVTSDNTKEANSYIILEPNYTFRLKGYPDAKKVFLSGDFISFKPGAFAMKHIGNEWVFSVHLTVGKHIYKFVVDGNWIRDPDNKQWEQNEYRTGDSVIWFGVE